MNLAIGSLVKYIIRLIRRIVKCKKPPYRSYREITGNSIILILYEK